MAKQRILSNFPMLYALGMIVVIFLSGVATLGSYFSSKTSFDVGSNAYLPSSEHSRHTNLRGFNSQLHITNLSKNGLNSEAFHKAVDTLAQAGLAKPMIRVGLSMDEVFPHTVPSISVLCQAPTSSSVKKGANYNFEALKKIKENLAYAKSKGVSVMVVTSLPSWATVYNTPKSEELAWRKKYTQQEYLTLTANIHRELAANLGAEVQVWNLFNESNIYAFDTHAPVNLIADPAYLNLFTQVFRVAAQTVSKYDKDAVITHDVSGIPGKNAPEYEAWKGFVTALKPYVSWGSTNLYFGDNEAAIYSIPEKLSLYHEILDKPVAVTEVGICTEGMTEAKQGAVLSLYLQQINSFNPAAVLVYQYQDDQTPWFDGCGRKYGVVSANGDLKQSYPPVISALRGTYEHLTHIATSNCRVTKEESFIQSLSGWTTASDVPETNGSLIQKPGQWAIDTTTSISGNFKVELEHEPDSLSLPFENWAGTTYHFFTPNNFDQAAFKIMILREQAGYSLHLVQGSLDKSYSLGSSFAPLQKLTIHRQGNVVFVSNGDRIIGQVDDLFLRGVPLSPLQLGVVTDTFGPPTPTKLGQLRYLQCED